MVARRKKKKKSKRSRKPNPQMSDKMFGMIADYREALDKISSYGDRIASHLQRGTAMHEVIVNFNDQVNSVIEELDDLMSEAD